MERHQAGTVCEASGKLRYYTGQIINGKREQRSQFLCNKDDRHYVSKVKESGKKRKKIVLSKPLRILRDEFMLTINKDPGNGSSNGSGGIVRFWELRWEDFQGESVHIHRAAVNGRVGETKTPESKAVLPVIKPIRKMLSAWRVQCRNPKEGWLFPNRFGRPKDLEVLARNSIVPVLTARGFE